MNISGERNHHRCRSGYYRLPAPGRVMQGRRRESNTMVLSLVYRDLKADARSDEYAIFRDICCDDDADFAGECFITEGHRAAHASVSRSRCIGKDMPEGSSARTISVIVTKFSKNHSWPEKRARPRRPLRRCTTIFLIIALKTFLEEWETHSTENRLYSLLS